MFLRDDFYYNPNEITHPPAPTGYVFYGNAIDKCTELEARRAYSVNGSGVYLINDLIALANPYFKGFSVYVRKGAKNQSLINKPE